MALVVLMKPATWCQQQRGCRAHPAPSPRPRLTPPPPPAALGGALSVEAVVEFVDAGHDVLLAMDSSASEELRALAAELGVDVEPAGTAVIDHFSVDAALDAGGDHTAVLAAKAARLPAVFGAEGPATPVAFRGIGLSVSPESETVRAGAWRGEGRRPSRGAGLLCGCGFRSRAAAAQR